MANNNDTLITVGIIALTVVGALVVYKLVTNDDSLSGVAKDIKGSVKGNYKDIKGDLKGRAKDT